MCQLLRSGLIAALAPVGVPNADIVVTDSIGDRLCAIQVKARRDKGADGGWHMNEKHENLVAPTLFYCFVDFGKKITDSPRTWIMPSAIVADTLKRSHIAWLNTPGRKGQARKDSDMRRLLPDHSKHHNLPDLKLGWLDQYLEAWRLVQVISEFNETTAL